MWWCWPLNWAAGWGSSKTILEKIIAPADYYRPWWNLERFYDKSIFLPKINNESPSPVNEDYKRRITNVTNLALFKWNDDRTIHPKESSWFGYFNEYHEVIKLKDSPDYINDLIGLRTLDEAGKLYFYSDAGDHMYFPQSYIQNYLIPLLLDQTPMPS
mgnify:CR=1 FL=1